MTLNEINLILNEQSTSNEINLILKLQFQFLSNGEMIHQFLNKLQKKEKRYSTLVKIDMEHSANTYKGIFNSIGRGQGVHILILSFAAEPSP